MALASASSCSLGSAATRASPAPDSTRQNTPGSPWRSQRKAASVGNSGLRRSTVTRRPCASWYISCALLPAPSGRRRPSSRPRRAARARHARDIAVPTGMPITSASSAQLNCSTRTSSSGSRCSGESRASAASRSSRKPTSAPGSAPGLPWASCSGAGSKLSFRAGLRRMSWCALRAMDRSHSNMSRLWSNGCRWASAPSRVLCTRSSA